MTADLLLTAVRVYFVSPVRVIADVTTETQRCQGDYRCHDRNTALNASMHWVRVTNNRWSAKGNQEVSI